MPQSTREWLKQSDNDIRAADIMFQNRQNMYAIFMAHLSIEKSLKGLYVLRLDKEAPRIHNLILLVETIGLDMPPDLYEFVVEINRMSIVTRYPDDLNRMNRQYNRKVIDGMMKKCREVLKWLKKQY